MIVNRGAFVHARVGLVTLQSILMLSTGRDICVVVTVIFRGFAVTFPGLARRSRGSPAFSRRSTAKIGGGWRRRSPSLSRG